MTRPILGTIAALLVAHVLTAPALNAQTGAKESLGVYSGWAAFRDEAKARCYAIARPRGDDGADGRGAFASVASWPALGIRGQIHIRLARKAAPGSSPILRIGSRRFELAASGRDAWARDAAMDAAIIAAMRSAETFRVSARAAGGGLFTSRYDLDGIATAIDAAVVGCASMSRRASPA